MHVAQVLRVFICAIFYFGPDFFASCNAFSKIVLQTVISPVSQNPCVARVCRSAEYGCNTYDFSSKNVLQDEIVGALGLQVYCNTCNIYFYI